MRFSGFDDPDSSGWDALHKGTDRESFDSPSKFDMSTLSTIMPKRRPAQPPQVEPDEQGYTDEDTREWGSSAPVIPEEEVEAQVDWDDVEPSEWSPPPAPMPPPPMVAREQWSPPLAGPTRYPPLTAVPPPPPTGPVPAQVWTPPVQQPQWSPPPDPETRWIPQTEPISSPADYGWEEPDTSWGGGGGGRSATGVPVASVGSRVRPYTRTGGRTRSDHNLALEALVSTSDDGRRYRGVRSIEHRRICDLCLDTRSVAEIAAHLRLPLGVVKVLVGDMSDLGLVFIHQTELILGDQTSREFMERVLAGLRAL